MKKLMLFMICALLFTGCVRSSEESDDSHQTTLSDMEITSESVIENYENEDVVAINNLLDEIMTVYPGTAGCSLRAAITATKCMKLADKLRLTSNDISEVINNYYGYLSEEEKQTFIESVNIVISTLEEFMNDWENSKAILEDAGIAEDFRDYVPDNDRISPLYNALNDFVSEI